jgi:hypothetical protein
MERNSLELTIVIYIINQLEEKKSAYHIYFICVSETICKNNKNYRFENAIK